MSFLTFYNSYNIDLTLRHAATMQERREYMTAKYKWDKTVSDDINWLIHANVLQALPTISKKSTTQFIHDWLPVLAHPGQQV